MCIRDSGLPVQFNFFAFLPEVLGGVNPYLDPQALRKQQTLVSTIVARFHDVPFLAWDLINEPSISQHLWMTRPNGDPIELAAATMGVNLTRYKLLAFGMSAAIAGMGGAFYPLVAGSVSPQPFWLFTSLQLAAIAVLMGVRYVPAAFLGGVFMSFVPDLLTRYGHGTAFNRFEYDISFDWFQIAVGVLLVIQLIVLPDGVWGDLRNRALHAWSVIRPEKKTKPVTVAS